MISHIVVRQLGLTPYLQTYQAMHDFTLQRTNTTQDEIWLTEHFAVFTQGKAGKAEHLLTDTGNIPVVQTDRGGQITYHAPGQQIMYTLIDLKRRKLSIRQMVSALENSVITSLATLNIKANSNPDAPGVYVSGAKICSLGLHIKQGRTLHGLALNINMDLSPFKFINPCGYKGLVMTQVSDLTPNFDKNKLIEELVTTFTKQLDSDYQDRH